MLIFPSQLPTMAPRQADTSTEPTQHRRTRQTETAGPTRGRAIRGRRQAEQPLDDAGECIDLNVSDSSSESAFNSGPVTHPAPSLPSRGGSRGPAHDVNHFFRRADKNDPTSLTVCKQCE
jgi:hypothetical protein